MHCGTIQKFLIKSIAMAMMLGAAIGKAQSPANSSLPYEAIVKNEGAIVRSGPGEVHYATSKLSRNAIVEVYRHDPGGWLAIRPVEGSFCLVTEDCIKIVDSGLAEITQEGTQAWIGTSLGPVDKPLWQVKLKAGEQVAVLGDAAWPNASGDSTRWYQIAPPSGEFRWVHQNDVLLPPVVGAASHSQPDIRPSDFMGPPPQPQDLNGVVQATYTQAPREYPPGGLTLNAVNRGWKQATRDAAGNRFSTELTVQQGTQQIPGGTHPTIPYVQSSGAPSRLASANTDVATSLRQLGNLPGSYPATGMPFNGARVAGSQTISPRLMSLELKLNNEMLKRPNQWRLIDIQTVADSIYRGTTDPLERLQAQRLLEKLARCRALRSGFQLSQGQQPGGYDGNAIGSGVAGTENVSLGTIYDAQGWLNELITDGGAGAGSYVLQDEKGKITHHIAAAPGLNLQRYVKSKVGIIGQRGYHSRFKLDHVTAEKVVELQRR